MDETLAGLASAIDEVAAGPVWSLSDERLSAEVGLVYAAGQRLQARLLSLQKLHSREVAYFISRPGNGLSRWGRLPRADRLEACFGPLPELLVADSEVSEELLVPGLEVSEELLLAGLEV